MLLLSFDKRKYLQYQLIIEMAYIYKMPEMRQSALMPHIDKLIKMIPAEFANTSFIF